MPDDGDWLAGTAHAASHAAALTAPVSAVELLVEASPGLGLTLSELCELFDEIEAPSVPEILDVGMTEEQEAVAVLEATLGSSVDELLDRPNPLTAGEIVTILAPVVETLVELHEHGVSLGALRCQDVRLTAAGRPVLKDWHAVARLPEVDGRARASVARDWKSLESMADLVLAQLPSQTELPAALERELDRCLSGEVDAQIGHRLLDALFPGRMPGKCSTPRRASGRHETRSSSNGTPRPPPSGGWSILAPRTTATAPTPPRG